MTGKKRIGYLFIGIIVIIGCFFLQSLRSNWEFRGKVNHFINQFQGKTLNEQFTAKIKSGNLSTDYEIAQVLQDIDKFQLNTINIPIVVEIKDLQSTDMTVSQFSIEKAKKLIKEVKKKDKKVNIILEAYPWIANGSLYETQWKPNNINTFFLNWKTKVLKVLIEEIAVPYHVDALNIASNFTCMEYAEGYWCDTIDYVREEYKGLITYRTSFWSTAEWKPSTITEYESKLNNRLFSKVDFISIGAYFELSDKKQNSVEDLVQAIESTKIYNRKQNVKKEIKNFYDKWKKPIFFGELGFPKTDGAAVHPWDAYQNTTVNTTEQANCFEAYRRTFEKEPWFLGFSIFAIGENSVDKHYYPSKESELILRNWYKENKK